jgi:predicted nucleotidyltransferase
VRSAEGAAFDGEVVADIDRRLQLLSGREQIRVLLAVESGSRAWGFPSPDSDYDCRFIYARRTQDYLSLFPARDVIEEPFDRVLDIGGWDLAKALRLLLKGNAVVVEWLMSPFVYAGDDRFRAECLDLAHQALRPPAVARHYLHLGERQRRTYFADLRSIPLKKMFYALRPAVALRWLRMHDDRAIVPMHFPTLVAQTDLPGDVVALISDLMARKAATRELGTGPLPAPIGALIDAEFTCARTRWLSAASPPDPGARNAADQLFRRWIGGA